VAKTELRRSELHWRSADGVLLFRRGWIPASPEHVLVVVHGYAEHGARYEGLASWFAARGFAVHAHDHRGHGRSGGTRMHLQRFAELLDDLEAFLALVRSEHPGLPITLIGHSMGALVSVAFLAERKPAVASAVTSGAALALGPGVSRSRIAGARLLRHLAPRLRVGTGIDAEGLSRDPEVVRGYLEDPQVGRHATASFVAELLGAIPRAAAMAAEIRVPLLALHGEDDSICPPHATHALGAAVRTPGSELRVYPKLRHEIFNEPEREQVMQDVVDWLARLEAQPT
jgi:alpha-beta hydrolase superfamily lysophospholipase